jgi:hypothetical protein
MNYEAKMIHIIVNGADTDQVLEWSQRIVRTANSYTDTGRITYTGVKRDEAGGYEAYVTVITGEQTEGRPPTVIRAAPPALGGDDPFRQVDIYTALGQLWGLAEAILGQPEANVKDLLEDHVWSTIGPNRRDRIRWLFDSLPQYYVLSAVRAAKREEEITGYDMMSYHGLYWPAYFYAMALANPDTKNGQAIIREFINPNPPPVIRIGD